MVVAIVPEDMVGVVLDVVGVAMDVDSNFPIDSDVHIVFHIYGNKFNFVGCENKTSFAGEPKLT